MKYLLDTCVVSDFVKGDPGTIARLTVTQPDDVAVSVVTCFEVTYGLMLDKRRARGIGDNLRQFFDAVHTLDFCREDAASAAAVRSELRKVGRPIGPYDVLIAGTARQRELVLVTANTDEFSRVSGLSLENWR